MGGAWAVAGAPLAVSWLLFSAVRREPMEKRCAAGLAPSPPPLFILSLHAAPL